MSTKTFLFWYLKNASGALSGITGGAGKIAFIRESDSYWYNFTTGAWVASVNTTDGRANLAEVSGTVPVAGLYSYSQDTTLWPNGSYEGVVTLTKAGESDSAKRVLFDVVDGTAQTVGPSPAPASGLACNVYDYIRNPDDSGVPATCQATAEIIGLPYYNNSAYHAGDRITGTYNASTGLLSWTFAQGARVRFSVPSLGINGKIYNIPAATSAKLSDLEG